MDKFEVFKIFIDAEQAKAFADNLKENGIECLLVDNSLEFDASFADLSQKKEIQLQIKQSDFTKATLLIEKGAQSIIYQIDKDHYLYSFSNEELYEILLKQDEWNAVDYALAQQILADRGEVINEDLLTSLKKQRLQDMAKPEKGQLQWVYIGYLFSLLGGFIGIMIGWHIWKSKKTLPDGSSVFAFSESYQKHGRNIFILGVIILPAALIWKLSSEI